MPPPFLAFPTHPYILSSYDVINHVCHAFSTRFLVCFKYHIMDVLCALGIHNQQMSDGSHTEGFACRSLLSGSSRLDHYGGCPHSATVFQLENTSLAQNSQLCMPNCAPFMQFTRICCKLRHFQKHLMSGYCKPIYVGGSGDPGLLI